MTIVSLYIIDFVTLSKEAGKVELLFFLKCCLLNWWIEGIKQTLTFSAVSLLLVIMLSDKGSYPRNVHSKPVYKTLYRFKTLNIFNFLMEHANGWYLLSVYWGFSGSKHEHLKCNMNIRRSYKLSHVFP